ncbi:fibronectin type III domain-containing protein [Candidatus Berkelbacteria bacterium]|nr:fibronectin type III domain-containing protein [Candidatus Berkelbacteria bacterium]
MWKIWVARCLLVTLCVQFLPPNFALATEPGAENRLVINEVSPTHDWVEIFNPSTAPINLSSWSISSSSSSLLLGNDNLNAGSYLAVELPESLERSEDWVKLNQADITVETLAWGDSLAATIPAPSLSDSIARTIDGTGRWVSNVDETEAATNATAIIEAPNTLASLIVAATDQTPENVITSANVNEVTLLGAFEGSASLNASIVDSLGNLTPLASTRDEQIASATLAKIDAQTLVDGAITLQGYTEHAGIMSAWTQFSAIKQTMSILASNQSAIIATETNPANTVNRANETAVVIEVPLADPSLVRTIEVALADNEREVTATGLPGATLTLDAHLLADGPLTLSAWVWDQFGNRSSQATRTEVIKDTVVPNPPQQTQAATHRGMVLLTWLPSESSDVASYRIYHHSNGEDTLLTTVDSLTMAYTTDIFANGEHKFIVRSLDEALNEDSQGDQIDVEINDSALTEQTVTSANRLANFLVPSQLLLIAAPSVTEAILGVHDHDAMNPTGVELPIGKIRVGRIATLSSSDSSALPLEIRLFYTQADLTAAGITTETQLEGIRFYNETEKRWDLYASTGVNATDITLEGVNYAGFLYARAETLDNVTGSADIAAPALPTFTRVEQSDGQAMLNWNAVPEAIGYNLRYRASNQTEYTTLFLSGGDFTQLTLKGLLNDMTYEIGLASLDAVRNSSAYTTVTVTPRKPQPIADFVVATTTSAPTATPTPQPAKLSATPTPTTAPAETEEPAPIGGQAEGEKPTDDSGQIKGGTDEKKVSDTTRTWVTLLIIIIAAAAGFGGYYGYQWWISKPETNAADSTPPPSEPKKNRRNDRGGRW